MKKTIKERLLENSQQLDSGCRVWTGARNNTEYGVISLHGRLHRTHRVAYEQWIGPIPDGKCVLHHCDNPPCFNPDHLWLGTHSDNARDRANKKQRHNSPTDHIAEKLRKARLKAGLSRAQAAELIGVSKRTIEGWELGRHKPYPIVQRTYLEQLKRSKS